MWQKRAPECKSMKRSTDRIKKLLEATNWNCWGEMQPFSWPESWPNMNKYCLGTLPCFKGQQIKLLYVYSGNILRWYWYINSLKDSSYVEQFDLIWFILSLLNILGHICRKLPNSFLIYRKTALDSTYTQPTSQQGLPACARPKNIPWVLFRIYYRILKSVFWLSFVNSFIARELIDRCMV